MGASLETVQESILHKPNSATKFMTYRTELNSSMDVHEIYREGIYIPDYLRQAFTRVRLMSHELKVETGRWSRVCKMKVMCYCSVPWLPMFGRVTRNLIIPAFLIY